LAPFTRPRRIAISAVALLGVALLVAGCTGDAGPVSSASGAPALSGDIVWADYGGPTNETRQVAYFDGFAEETGVEVVSTTIEDAIYMSMLTGDPGDYDVFQASVAEVLPNVANLHELPESAQGDLLPESVRPYFVGGFVFAQAQGWLTETFPDGGPQDWADFFDVAAFPGKRAWPGSPGSFDASYEIALLADGVAPEDLYPLDLERAEAKLDELRGDLVFYQNYPEVQQLLTSGSVSIASTVSGQFTALRNAGYDVTIQWNQAFSVASGLVVPRDVRNPAEVDALAEWINDPANQAVFAERTGYGPVNSEVFDHLSDEVAADLVNSPDHADKVLAFDDQWRADHYEQLLNSYTAWLAG